jgi:DNA-binding NarL/FixJ family response regulator
MKPEKKITVLIADDHSVVRAGLKALLSTEPDFEVVGEADNGARAVEMFTELRPDIALMDLRMPVKDGMVATREIRARHPSAAILILSTYQGDEDINSSLEAGAMGYVLKNSPGEELVPALRAVYEGERWIPREVGSKLAGRSIREKLTEREADVLQRLISGDSNKELADKLGITEHTVKAHLKSIIGKLGVRDRTEAVTVGLRRGIIRLPD